MILTYHYRIKNHLGLLNKQAKAVNFVWNYCVDIHKKSKHYGRSTVYESEFSSLLIGGGKELDLLQQSIQAISKQFINSRKQNKKCPRYRSNKKSLGWIPLVNQSLTLTKSGVFFRKQFYKWFGKREIPEDSKVLCGSNFSQDAKGNWYLNLVLEVPEPQLKPKENKEIGMDLGLKDFLTTSDGLKIECPKVYRKTEEKLAKAQRANKKKQIKNIHAKIKNQRKDFLHKLSTRLIKENTSIVVGNIESSKLGQTSLAKSVFDASWYSFKKMLEYKAIAHQCKVLKVNEAYTTVTCSSCLNKTGPTGYDGLKVREWKCSDCLTVHDRRY